jgi:hypothetical protein
MQIQKAYYLRPQILCLESLVGISQKDCECLLMPTEETTLNLVKKSKTGLYIDEHEGAATCLFLSKAQCGDGSIWDRLIQSRREAIQKVINDVAIELNSKFKATDMYNRTLGEYSYSGQLNTPAGKKSIILKTKKNIGGKLSINAIGFMAKLPDGVSEQLVTITITKKTIGENYQILLESEVVSFQYRIDMKTTYWNQRKVDIEMYDIEPIELLTDGSEYEISYQYDPSLFVPMDNQIVCNCEGVKAELRRFFKVVPTGSANGMLINIDYKCDDQFLVCALANNNQTLEFLISEAIRAMALYKFLSVEKTRATTGTTPNNVLKVNNYDELLGLISSSYGQYIQDIVSNYNLYNQKLDCFSCNHNQNIGRTEGIFVT